LLALSLTLVAGRPALACALNPAPSSVPPPLRFEKITTADGLSFPAVRDILQDRQGFIWFATDSGLNRYDGHQFTVYKEDPGDSTTIRFDDVRVLYEDSDGTLWVGGGGGLDRFDRATETFTHVDTRGQVFAIYEDGAGTLWAGFWHGLYGYDRATDEMIHADQPNPDVPADWAARSETSVVAIDGDPDGTLWIGTVAGLYRRDATTGAFSAYRHDPQEPASLGSDTVTALFVDRQGVVWIGTEGGLDRFDPASGTFLHYRHDPADPASLGDDTVLSILEDNAGTLWLGTTGGLDRFDPGQDRFLHYRHDPDDPASLGADVVLSLFEDRAGVFWAGTAQGVSKSNRRAEQFTRYRALRDPPAEPSYALDVSDLLQDRQPAILSDATVLALHEDASGVLWIGTFDGGLNRLDTRSGRLTVYRHDPDDPASLSSNRVGALFEDHAGSLWAGAGSDWLERFDPGTESFLHTRQLGAEVSALAEDPASNLWIGTSGEGLYRLGSDRLLLEHFPQFWQDPDHWWRNGSLSSHMVSTLQVDQAGILWAGTLYGGINLWGQVEDQFTHLRYDPTDPNSLSHDRVLSILEDPSQDMVWIGTAGGGLNRYDRATQRFTHYTSAEGLPGDTVGCILADEAGFLWLATVQGLSRFDPGAGTFRNYDRQDGVGVLSAAGSGSCLRSQAGELFFGGADGLYAFRPEQIKENVLPPPVAITALKIFDEPAYRYLSPGQEIRLPYGDNFVSFEFAALDYTMPEKNQYAYRLEGLDRDWVYAGTRRYADYPALDPGQYTFRVRGANSDGVWNEEGAAINLIVEPPFWQTWIFRLIVAGALVLGTVGVYRQRIRGIEARSRELARQVEERTQEIQQLSAKAQELAVMEERQHLARELHDAVSQTLFSASLIAEALPELWQANPDEGRELLVKLQQLSRGALAEMRALLMELRPAALAEASMADLLRQLGQAVSGREGIPVTVTVDEGCEPWLGETPAEVRITLYRIAQEALNNVVKHAQASRVDVSLHCTSPPPAEDEPPGQGGRLELCIRDDGLGFDPGAVSQEHLGLGIMHERAESIQARLEVESAPGGGTEILVVWTAPEEPNTPNEGGRDE
jgi:ligand-binding sensor domain-containing protein/signal transduction histidine kinase